MTLSIPPKTIETEQERTKLFADALHDLLDHVDQNTCTHESTHRGGSIWTICDDCGAMWADDMGGFKPYVDPAPVAKARNLLSNIGTAKPRAPLVLDDWQEFDNDWFFDVRGRGDEGLETGGVS